MTSDHLRSRLSLQGAKMGRRAQQESPQAESYFSSKNSSLTQTEEVSVTKTEVNRKMWSNALGE